MPESDGSQLTAESLSSPNGSLNIRRASVSSTSHEICKDSSEQFNSESGHSKRTSSTTSQQEKTASSNERHSSTISGNSREFSQSCALFSYYHSKRRVLEDTRDKSSLKSSETKKRRASSPARSNLPPSKRSRDERGSAGSDEWKRNIFERLGPSSSEQKKTKDDRVDKVNKSPSPRTRRRNRSRCNSSHDSPSGTSQSPLSSQYSSPNRPYSRSSSTTTTTTTTRITEDKKRSKSPPRSHHNRLRSSERDTERDRDNKKSTRDSQKSTESQDRRRSSERESSSRQTDRRREEKDNKLKRKKSHEPDTDSDEEARERKRRGREKSGQREKERERQDKIDSQQHTTHDKSTSEIVKSEREEKEICNISWDESELTADEMDTTVKGNDDVTRPTNTHTVNDTLKMKKEHPPAKEEEVVKTEADKERAVVVKEDAAGGGQNEILTDSVESKKEASKKGEEKEGVCNDREGKKECKIPQTFPETSSNVTVSSEVETAELPKRKKRRKRKETSSDISSSQSTGSADGNGDVDKKGKGTSGSSSGLEVKTADSSGREGVHKKSSDSSVTAPPTTQSPELQPPSTNTQQQVSLQIKEENTPSTTTDEFPTSRDYTERDVTPPLEVLQSMQSGYHPQTYYQSAIPFHPVTCTSSPASLAAFHQHIFTATQQDQLRLSQNGQSLTPVFSTSPLPFTVATHQQQSGMMATPGVWPVHVTSPVSPAQWHQLWLENQQHALRAGMIPPPPSVSAITEITGTGAQVIGISTQTTGTTVQTTGTAIETTGTTVQTTGTAIETTGTAIETSGTAIETSGTAIETNGTTVETTETAPETGTSDGTDAQATLQKPNEDSSTSPQPPLSLPAQDESEPKTIKSGTDQPSNPQTVQHIDQPTTNTTVEISSQDTETLTEEKDVATGTVGSDDSITTQSITSLMTDQPRRLHNNNKRRKMDATCRSQYREMMQEFRSRAAMLATSTKIMIR